MSQTLDAWLDEATGTSRTMTELFCARLGVFGQHEDPVYPESCPYCGESIDDGEHAVEVTLP